ncbi:MAG: hypothetical protein MJ214_01995 [Bacilli bacterium]|nr:hypothetical protein [Bacilli bacterium]
MKFIRCLLIASQALIFTACAKNENLPERKDGYTCNIKYTIEDHDIVKVVDRTPVAPMDEEFRCSFNVAYTSNPEATWKTLPYYPGSGIDKKYIYGELSESNIEYRIPSNGIRVLIGGKEYPNSFNFYYVSNTVNSLVIKKEYMVNDIEIKVMAEPHKNLTLYGIEFSETLLNQIQDNKLDFTFGSNYQNDKEPTPVAGHDNGQKYIAILNQWAYPVFEHDAIELDLTVINGGDPLPNIVVRTGAHYAMEGVDYTIKYTQDKKGCHISIPNYVVCDHLAFAAEGEK